MTTEEPNAWWVDDLDPDHIKSIARTPAELLHLESDGQAWLGLSDEHEFGGHAVYCHPDLAAFLQRALRLREGRHPVTGWALSPEAPAEDLLRALLGAP